MSMGDKIVIVTSLIILYLLVAVYGIKIDNCPTRAEVITICEELIKADSNTIFDIQYAGVVETYMLKQGLVLTGFLEPEELYPEIQWFIDRNEQRIEEKNEKFREE